MVGRDRWRKYVFDSLASIVFWVPVYMIFNIFIMRLEIWQVLSLAAFSVVINFALGGTYGRFLDRWRRKLGIGNR